MENQKEIKYSIEEISKAIDGLQIFFNSLKKTFIPIVDLIKDFCDNLPEDVKKEIEEYKNDQGINIYKIKEGE